MRVLHVLESLAAGGVETTFLNVLRRLPSAITSDVLAFSGGALETEYRAAAAKVEIASDRSTIDQLLVGGRYDVAYVLFERCAAKVVPTLVTRTTTAVVYGKNYDFSGQWRTTEGFHQPSDDALMAACDGVTFTTPQLASGFAERERTLVLGKGADVEPLLRLTAANDETPERILVIANPNPRKRLGDLIEALATVRHDVPGAHVRVLGQGDANEERRLRQCAERAGVADSFDLAGVTRDVAREISQSRIVALTSGSEGVPTALLEGMAAARPVLTTDAGHVRSIIDDGVEGFVVPIGDVAAIAARLRQLFTERSLAAAMGQSGRERAARHSVSRIADDLAAFLASFVHQPC